MRIPSSGHKRRFGAAGIVNILGTNMILQLLLASHGVTIALATLISQVFNGIFGYIMYGKWVFRCNAIAQWRLPLAYAALMSLLWCINTAGIQSISSAGLGISRNLAALAMVAPLAILSYAVQKYLIFRP
jgi:putative flippase GtrA